VTGLRVGEFDELVDDVLPRYAQTERERLTRPDRQRAIGAGHPFDLNERDHILFTVVWLRVYPTHEVLGYLFGVSDSTVSRLIGRVRRYQSLTQTDRNHRQEHTLRVVAIAGLINRQVAHRLLA
jgi:hypothetical protein